MRKQEEVLTNIIKGEAQATLSDFNYITWFDPIEITEINGEEITIAHHNPFAKKQFEQRFHGNLREILMSNGFSNPTINYTLKKKSRPVKGAPEKATEAAAPVAEVVQRPKAISGDGLNSKYQFKNFIVGNCNDLAYNTAIAISKGPGRRYNPLFIYGGVGLGKTHLIQAIGNEAREKLGVKVRYLTAEDFVNDFLDHIRNKKSGFEKRYRSVDILIVDDIQFIAGKTSTQEAFFNTFNALHQQNKQIILSSDRPPTNIPTLTDRLRSRFSMGVSIDISLPDLETRCAIIESKANELGQNISREVVEFMAENIKTNIRELEGIINKLIAYVEMKGIEPTIDVVQIIIDNIKPAANKHFTPRQIIIKTAEFFNIKPDDITSPSHKNSLERQISMYLIRSELRLSFPEIARVINRKDHTTVMYGVKKIEKGIKLDTKLNEQITSIREVLYV
ncbi:MAG: chromosomal replication initiator protein DnaA [Candidatus Nomurabacteria bacterium]|nr:chromosomal replication initiator protein DnaA [Candidatus Nomurabacteria bacterium]